MMNEERQNTNGNNQPAATKNGPGKLVKGPDGKLVPADISPATKAALKAFRLTYDNLREAAVKRG